MPAGFNNIVGLKPTRGWLSAAGVVPACRTLDCVSVFALTVDDALRVADIAGGYDARDPYGPCRPARPVPAGAPRFAVPDKLEFHGDAEAEAAFDAALLEVRATGAELRTVDFSPYAEPAALLYQGPWVAERFAAVEALWREQPGAIDPVVRGIVEEAGRYSALDAFQAEYRRAALARVIQQSLADVDALLVPTAPSIYTIAQLREDPLALTRGWAAIPLRQSGRPVRAGLAGGYARRRPARRHHRAGPGLAGPCAGRIRQALAGAPGPAAGRHRQAAARRAGVA